MSGQDVPQFGDLSIVTQFSVARELELDEIIARWDAGERADAQAALLAHPQLAESRSAVVMLAYEEYCQRLEADESIDVPAFVAKFAPHDTALKKVVALHDLDVGSLRLPEELKPGEKFDNYQIIEWLGRGAFSRVYLAFDLRAKRPVVLKLTTMPGLEPEALGNLESPYVVPVYAVLGSGTGGPTAIVMPFYGSATFDDLAARLRTTTDRRGQLIFDVAATRSVLPAKRGSSTLPPGYAARPFVEGAVWLLRGVAEGLSKAHKAEFVHFDLKPSNILLAAGASPMLADFNLSQRLNEQSLAVGGTVPYMAPEQLRRFNGRDKNEVTAAADVYSFGVIAHELLTGMHPYGPFDAGLKPRDLAGVLEQRMKSVERKPTSIAGTNGSLCRLIDECLSIDPAKRPSAEELRQRLTRELGLIARSVRTVVRKPLVGVFAAGMVIAALAGGGMAWNSLSAAPVQNTAGSYEQNYAAALEAFGRSEFLQATEFANRVLAVVPDHVGARVLKARIAIEQKNFAEAVRLLEPLVGSSQDVDLKSLFGYACVETRQWDRAIKVLLPLLNAGHETPANLNNYAHALIWANRREEAERILNGKKLLGVNDPALHYNRAFLERLKAQSDITYIPTFGLQQAIQAENPQLQGPRGETSILVARLRIFSGRIIPPNADDVLSDLRRAIENGYRNEWVLGDPQFSPFQSHPEFRKLADIKGDPGRLSCAKFIRPL